VSGVERVSSEAGRTVFGNYLMIRPGTADLTYRWRTPDVVTTEGDERVYRLTIQKQPGMRSEAVRVQIALPEGASVVDATPGATRDGATLGYAFDLTQDRVIEVRFRVTGSGS
jgi:hypothetical protein